MTKACLGLASGDCINGTIEGICKVTADKICTCEQGIVNAGAFCDTRNPTANKDINACSGSGLVIVELCLCGTD